MAVGTEEIEYTQAEHDPSGKVKKVGLYSYDPLSMSWTKQNPILGSAGVVGTGNGSVTTAGTKVQLPNQACSRVIITSNSANGSLANGGIIVIGDTNVVAAEATRKGVAIYPTQQFIFYVTNLNLLYIDSVDDGAKYHYYYEY